MATSAELDVLYERDITEEVAGDLCTTGEGPFLLTATVTGNVVIPSYVFVLQREATSPDIVDRFTNVASLSDMDNLNPGSPSSGQSRYRVSSIRLRFSSLAELENVYSLISSDLNDLVGDWNLRAQTFISQETVHYPLTS